MSRRLATWTRPTATALCGLAAAWIGVGFIQVGDTAELVLTDRQWGIAWITIGVATIATSWCWWAATCCLILLGVLAAGRITALLLAGGVDSCWIIGYYLWVTVALMATAALPGSPWRRRRGATWDG